MTAPEQPNHEAPATPPAQKPQEALFEAALALPAAQRPAFLARACASDPALRQQVEMLLRAHELAGDFLDVPAAADPPPTSASSATPVRPEEQPGDCLGRYKLLQKIGEGGCGAVYLAEQQEPVVRRVALKVIKLGMDTKEVIARFEAERQALALMDHPNIAHVFDAGTTDLGRPFFVMELVQGLPITAYCDQHNLSTGARLELFTQVCHAVQHAHQKGIIHRDLKPSNILVALSGDRPLPKVIDFGIAKATQGRLTDATLFTAFEQFIGTPAYMSPEQAEMSGLDIDTRSDIYSLGVLLYELLTGRTPFDAKELIEAGLDEIRRRIREVEPPKPSTRLSTMEGAALTTAARLRQTEPPRLLSLVRGDLDWIVMRCLEKDRTRRYETANGLAADIQRHLAHEPVVACPPSAVYLLGKFARRHRIGFAAGTAILASVVIGAALATWQAVRATRAERTARTERDRAEVGEKRAQTEATRAENLAQKESAARQNAEQLAEKIREHLYVARINAAQQAWEQGDTERVLNLLDSLRPGPDQADLRGFEWYHFWKLCHSEKYKLAGHPWHVRSVAFSPDGRTLASAGQDPAIRLWNMADGQLRTKLEGHTSWIGAVAYSPDGKTLVSGSADRTVRFWDTATGRVLFGLPEFPEEVICLALSPDGKQLAVGLGLMVGSGGNPMTELADIKKPGDVQIWDVATRSKRTEFRAHQAGLINVVWAPDGRTLATSNPNGEIKIWNAASGREEASLPRLSYQPAFGLAFSPDGRTLATGRWNPWDKEADLALWDTRNWVAAPRLRRRIPPLMCLTFSPDGRLIATGGKDEIAHVWNVADGVERAGFKGHRLRIQSVAFSPDGHSLATASDDGFVRVWDIDRNPNHEVLAPAYNYRLAFTPDSAQLIGAASANEVQVWSVAEGKRQFNLPLFAKLSNAEVAISSNGRTLAVASADGLLHVFDLEKRALRFHLNTRRNEGIWYVAISPDGRLVATAGTDNKVVLWDGATGKEIAALGDHRSRVMALAFTPDGQALVAGGADETVFWDPATRTRLRSWSTGASRFAISRDGKMLAARSGTQAISLLEMPSGRQLACFEAHQGSIWSVGFSADGKTLVTASTDGTTRLWRVPNGELLMTIPSDRGINFCARFSPDGRTLAIGSGSPSSAGGTQVALLRAATEAEVNAPQPTVQVVKMPKHSEAASAQKSTGTTSAIQPPAPSLSKLAGPKTTPISNAPAPITSAEAIAAATRALEKNPKLAGAYVSRGYLRQNSGDLAGAMADLNQAIALDPQSSGAYSNRGINWLAQGDFSGAIADFDQAIALDRNRSGYPHLYRYLCVRRLQTDEPATSFAATVAAWKDGWSKSIGRYLLGALNEEQFLELARRGGGRTPNARPCEAYYYAGMAHLLRGKPAAARKFFGECLALNETTLTATLLARSELARLPPQP